VEAKRLEEFFQQDGAGFCTRVINYDDLVFEERIKLACYSCEKYGKSWHCPPRIPALDYHALLGEYAHHLLVYREFPFRKTAPAGTDSSAAASGHPDYNEVRRESTQSLHKTLLRAERFCWENNVAPVASFIGGSCKLCKNGCNQTRCANPAAARISLEALGVNVIRTAQNAGLAIIRFPPEDILVRMGLLCW
jgi:predicted metal-binding protein